MSRTDKDQPHEVQLADPYLRRRMEIRHEHLRVVTSQKLVEVTWEMLEARLRRRTPRYEYVYVRYAAMAVLFGHLRPFRYLIGWLADTEELAYVSNYLYYYLMMLARLPEDTKITGQTVVGWAYHYESECFLLECDYHQDNTVEERRLRLSRERSELYSSGDMPRCSNGLAWWNPYNEVTAYERRTTHRQDRHQARQTLIRARQIVRGNSHRLDKLELDPPPPLKR